MPNKSTNKLSDDSFYQDQLDILKKGEAMVLIINEKKKALSRSSKKTIAIHLTDEQLEFLETCVNTEILNTVRFDDGEEWDEDYHVDDDCEDGEESEA